MRHETRACRTQGSQWGIADGSDGDGADSGASVCPSCRVTRYDSQVPVVRRAVNLGGGRKPFSMGCVEPCWDIPTQDVPEACCVTEAFFFSSFFFSFFATVRVLANPWTAGLAGQSGRRDQLHLISVDGGAVQGRSRDRVSRTGGCDVNSAECIRHQRGCFRCGRGIRGDTVRGERSINTYIGRIFIVKSECSIWGYD